WTPAAPPARAPPFSDRSTAPSVVTESVPDRAEPRDAPGSWRGRTYVAISMPVIAELSSQTGYFHHPGRIAAAHPRCRLGPVAIPVIGATTAAAMNAAANCRGPQDRSATTARESEVRRRCRQDVSRVMAPPCPTITTIHSHKGRRRLDGSAQAHDVEASASGGQRRQPSLPIPGPQKLSEAESYGTAHPPRA